MKKTIGILAGLFVCLQSYAMTDIIFHHPGPASVLSTCNVKAICCDSKGYVWLGSPNGVECFDGYSCSRYELPGVNPREDLVYRIREDGNGIIWIITKEGDYILNHQTNELAKVDSNYPGQFELIETEGQRFIDDDGNLWLANERRIYYYLFAEKSLTAIENPVGKNVQDISARNGNAIILFEDGTFYRTDPQKTRLIMEGKIEISSFVWHYIYIDQFANVWFYTAHSPVDGLKCYSMRNRDWKQIPSLSKFDNTSITSVSEDSQGNIWIGSESDGLFILDKVGGTLHPFTKESTGMKLPSNHINRVTKDRDGNMWICTHNCGITCGTPRNGGFKAWDFKCEEEISGIVEDRAGNIWIGTDGDGIYKFNKTGDSEHYSKGDGLIDSDIITSITADSSGRLWVGTFTRSVQYFENGKFWQIPGLSSNTTAYIKSLAIAEPNQLWVATVSNGIFFINLEDKSIHNIDKGEMFPFDQSVQSILADSDGWLYVATSSGLGIYDTRTSSVIISDRDFQIPENQSITSLFSDAKGRIWVGLTDGLYLLDKISHTLEKITENSSAFNVTLISEDAEGRIWAASEDGLICLGNDKEGSRSFTLRSRLDEHELEQTKFKNNAAVLTSDGDFLLCSAYGILKINPEITMEKRTARKLHFTKLYLFDTPVFAGDETKILKKDISETEKLKLRFNQNNFSLDLSMLDINANDRVKYEYRILADDGHWMGLQGNRISLNALKPGKYIIEARANDNWGWTSNVVSLEVQIKPHTLKSPIALIIYALLVLTAVNLYLKNKKEGKKMERELAVQKEIDENRMRFFSNINHDLKTPLSLIISPIENAISNNQQQAIREYLDMALKNARLLLEEFNQLLDVRKIDSGSEVMHYSRADVVSFAKDVIGNYRYYVDKKGYKLHFSSSEDRLEMDFDRTKMRRIIMNLISNAVKYNTEGGCIAVDISRADEGNVRLSVADTGLGIKDSEKTRVFDRFYQVKENETGSGSGIGLHIVKEYVALHNGTISIEDNKPKGTIFKLEFPVAAGSEGTEMAQYTQEITRTDGPGTENKPRILIVEDNDDFRAFLERCLSVNYSILTASNGREALEALGDNEFSLVVSDVMMPEMDGFQLCRKIKSDILLSHIPVILLTAKNSDVDVINGLKCGADEYIAKPFNLEILNIRIRKIIDWSMSNRKKINKGISLEPSEITVSSLDEQLITKAIRIVEENMDNSDFSVEDLSLSVGMTRGHLYKKLMFIMGVSPVKFITIIRMKRGKSLLDQGWTNISEVAYSVGYSPKQFSKHFKEIFGCLPSDYIH